MNFTAFINTQGEEMRLEWVNENENEPKSYNLLTNFNVTWRCFFVIFLFIFGSILPLKIIVSQNILNMDEIFQWWRGRERNVIAYKFSCVCIERLISMEQSQWEDMYCLMKRTLSDFFLLFSFLFLFFLRAAKKPTKSVFFSQISSIQSFIQRLKMNF